MDLPGYASIVLALMMSMAGGGPNDLLGYVSSSAYWKSKGVVPTVDRMLAELTDSTNVAKSIDELSAADPQVREKAVQGILAAGRDAIPQLESAARDGDAETAAQSRALIAQLQVSQKSRSVRRLMAIRTLGELKKPEAVGALRPLSDSKEQFVADYARQAIASIEGKPAALPARPPADRLADVNLLPQKQDMVCQLVPTGGQTLPLEKIFEGFPMTVPGDDRDALIQRINARVIGGIEAIGNVRLDSVTLGWYTAPLRQPGDAIIIARGDFDVPTITDYLQRNQVTKKVFSGTDAWFFDDTTALLFPQPGIVLFVVAETNGEMRIDEALAAISKGSGTFSANADLHKLIQSIDTKKPFWMVTKVQDLRQLFTFLGPIDTFTLVAGNKRSANPPAVSVQITAAGADPVEVAKAVVEAKNDLRETANALAAQAALVPAFKAMSDMAQSVRIRSDGTKVTADGDVTLGALVPMVLESGVSLDHAEPDQGQNK